MKGIASQIISRTLQPSFYITLFSFRLTLIFVPILSSWIYLLGCFGILTVLETAVRSALYGSSST